MTDPTKISISGAIDWEMLAQQKRCLLETIDGADAATQFCLNGILSLLDHIQDEAEKQGFPVVFLTEDEEDA